MLLQFIKRFRAGTGLELMVGAEVHSRRCRHFRQALKSHFFRDDLKASKPSNSWNWVVSSSPRVVHTGLQGSCILCAQCTHRSESQGLKVSWKCVELLLVRVVSCGVRLFCERLLGINARPIPLQSRKICGGVIYKLLII